MLDQILFEILPQDTSETRVLRTVFGGELVHDSGDEL